MSSETTRPPLQVLRDSLRAEAPLRESSVARVMAISSAVAMPFILSLAMFQSWTSSLAINAFLLVVVAYYLVQLRAMKRGWYHPAIAWANVFVEVSVPAAILVVVALVRGPQYSLMTPTYVIWGGLVVTSALRATPRLSLAAGFVAAVQWLILYATLIYPRLGPDPSPAERIPSAILRAAILVICGGFAFLIARHFIRKTEEALVSVREQDLMGKYFLHERLGAGGMAEVYRATYCPEGGFQKPVAIKRVLPDFAKSESFVEMFREEARLCASLNHPNVVQVFDCGRFRDSFILAMEFVDGLPLNRLLKRAPRPLPFNAISYLAAELAAALDYIHRRVDAQGKPLKLVHRDVNPPNILVSRIGEVKLGDFGVANAATRVETGRTDIFYGKLHYAAPEQVVVGDFDGRADLFAMGLTLIEAITRGKVYTAQDDGSLNKGIFPRIPRPSEVRPDTPEALEALVMRLVAHDRNRRPATGGEVRAAFCALEGDLAPYPAGQQALAELVEETIALGDLRASKPRSAPAISIKQGGERLTSVLAREEAKARAHPAQKPAAKPGSAPSRTSSLPPLAGGNAPTANLRAAKPPADPRATVPMRAATPDAIATQALTDAELEKALEVASSGAKRARAPARDPDEDTLLDEDEPPRAADKPVAGGRR